MKTWYGYNFFEENIVEEFLKLYEIDKEIFVETTDLFYFCLKDNWIN